MPMIEIVEDLRLRGPRIDVNRALQMELQCLTALEQYEQWWKQSIPQIDVWSPKQLVQLFHAQGMPIQYETRVNKITKQRIKTPTANAEALELYRDTYKSQLAGLVLEMRKLKKASDFTHLHSSDGFAHSQYKIHGQVQGRLQSKNPDLQNIPDRPIAGIRPRCLVVPDSKDDCLINADFDQLELWVYAWQANDQKLLDAKAAGDYVYGVFWEEWYEEEIRRGSVHPFFTPACPRTKAHINPAIKAEDILRIKSGPLGLLYGRQADSLMALGFKRDFAQRAFARFFRDHHAIKEFHDRQMHEVTKSGIARSPFGRIRRFPNAQGMKPEVLSFYGQNPGSDILKQNALIQLHTTLPDFGARILLTVHDQVLVNCPLRNAVSCKEHIEQTMASPLPQMDGFSIPATIKLGPNWGDVTSYEKWSAKRASASSVVSEATH
jgi:DNA polymerase-1